MNKWIKSLMVIVPVTLISAGFYLKTENSGEDILVKVILENLRQAHYNPIPIDDNFSEKAWTNYLENLDPNKRFLTQEDIKILEQYKKEIDNESQNGTYEFFNKSLELMATRVKETQSYYKEILDKPFNFTVNESVNFSEDLPYAKNSEELKDRWRKYLKYSVMTRLASAMDVQEATVEKAKSDKSENGFDVAPELNATDASEDPEMDVTESVPETVTDAGTEIKTFETMEEDARKAVLKTHNEWFDRIARLNRKDRMATYVNSLTMLFDPHTGYFPPADKDNFDIHISGKLEGIGATLQEKDGYIRVVSIVPGSPSAIQGELQANDLILKVAQGKEAPVDIVNARIDDAVKIIRGKKGTEVRLTVQKPDGSVKVIPIIREVIVLEETFAKSTMIHDKNGIKTGYIYLPSFYTDFNDHNGRTSWKDVRDEVRKLKEDGAMALIFDMRNNGGGSLNDVVEMAGLFIPKGPIVQVKSRNSDPYIMKDNNADMEWDKPIVVMVNEFSASASEIMAAALQDYNRAVIVGSHQTHGKGTVQRFIDLNQTLRSNDYDDLGSLKLTTQKFYRVNGGATQLNGVVPDIIWPDNYTYLKTGEREEKFAMPWDKIASAEYTKTNAVLRMDMLKRASEKRTKANPVFGEIETNAKRWKEQSETTTYTLNLEKYRAEQKARKELSDAFNKLFTTHDDLTVTTLSADKKEMEVDDLKKKRAEDWYKSIKKDVYLYESLQIAEDMVRTSK
ncbi:MAG: tail-specific protease [Bacteroidetes bacterium]|nr:tail-specific protease [Bacteroidota bacterium]